MKYSPKRVDTGIRVIYSISLVASIVIMMIPAKGALSSVLSSVALLLLALAIFLFIKYDATTYEYILIERNGTFDFYVNKINGRRGAYVCYFPLSDCVELGSYGDNTRQELNNKYSRCSFSKYVQNFMSGKKFFALFRHESGYQCIVFEPNAEMIKLFEDFAGKAPMSSDVEVDDISEQNQENE